MDNVARAFALVGTVCLGLLALVAVLAFSYAIHPPRYLSARTPADLSWPFERVSLTTRDGVGLKGWYIPRSGGSDGKAVIVLHGYPFSKGDILGVTHFLHDYYDLFLFDFRYFGESDGAITTLGHREWQDVVVAVDHLQGRGISSIGVWGFSLGAAVALLALPHTEHVDAVVADSPYVDLGAMAMDYYGNIPLLSHTLTFFTDVLARTVVGVSPATVSPLVAASSAGTPLLFIHGASDRTIPPTHFERFRSALAGKAHAEFWLIEDAGHGLTYATQRERYEARVLAFFTRHLG